MANESGDPADPEIIIADEPEGEGVVVEPDKQPEEAAPQNVTTSDDLAALRAQLVQVQEAEQRANERAEAEARRAAEAQTNVASTFADALRAHEYATQHALVAAQTKAERAQADYARLALEGKFDEAASAMSQLVRAQQEVGDGERRLKELERTKAHFEEEQRKAAEAAAQPQRVQPQQPQAPRLSPRTQAWIDAHPKMQTDAAYRNAAMGAHSLALHKNIQPDTDEYFSFIETQLGERQASPEPVRRAASSAAPPSRAIAPQAGVTPATSRVIRLTEAQRRTADEIMGYIKDPKERYRKYGLQVERMNAEKPLLSGQAN